MNQNKPRGDKTEKDVANEAELSEEPKIKLNNNIRDIRSVKQLEKVNLDFESPRLKKAMDDYGITQAECEKKERFEFEKKGVDPDVVDLRFKHYQGRLIDTINQIIERRREYVLEDRK